MIIKINAQSRKGSLAEELYVINEMKRLDNHTPYLSDNIAQFTLLTVALKLTTRS